MTGLTLDQVRVLLAVVEHGSFSGAARALGRAQSAVTHAVQRLEDQLGLVLFDRDGYRPVLTEAALALLPRARRLVDEAAGLGSQALAIAGGVEAELTLVVEALFPMHRLVDALHAFSQRHPSVVTRIYVEALGAATALVLDGTCALGLLPEFFSESEALERRTLFPVELVPVAAPSHPLARIDGPVPPDTLRTHVQLVLTDRSGLTGARDHGVLASRTWRLGDLGAKHAMLRAGLGWGNMPRHTVADDLATGRLRIIRPEASLAPARLLMCAATRRGQPPGPATRWLAGQIAADAERSWPHDTPSGPRPGPAPGRLSAPASDPARGVV